MGLYVSGYQGNFNPNYAASIPATTATSGVINCGGLVLCGVLLPTTFTGTTLTFLMCSTATGTFVPVYSTTSGTKLSYTVAQGQYCAIDPKDFQGINFLQIVSGSTESATRALVCSLKGF